MIGIEWLRHEHENQLSNTTLTSSFVFEITN